MLRSSRITDVEEQLGLPLHRQAQVVVEVGEALAVRARRFERAELQPLAAELLHQRPRLRVREHAAHLRLEHAWSAQPSARPPLPQSRASGMLAHRK